MEFVAAGQLDLQRPANFLQSYLVLHKSLNQSTKKNNRPWLKPTSTSNKLGRCKVGAIICFHLPDLQLKLTVDVDTEEQGPNDSTLV